MGKSAADTFIQIDDDHIDEHRVSEPNSSHSTGSFEISMQDACDSISQDAKIGRALIRLVSTVIFWCVASVALSRRPRTTLQWDQVLAVSSVLATNGDNIVTSDTPMQFYNIGSIDDVYDWLVNTMVPSVFITEDVNGNILPKYQQGQIATLNKVLGGVIFDVTRKSAKTCNPNDVVTELYPNCSDSDSTTLERSFFSINLNATEVTQAISALKRSDKGVNYYTKRLEVTIATYNGDFEGYSVTSLQLDFGDSGYIKPTSATNSARGTPYQWKNAVGDAAYAFSYVVWLFVIFYWGTGRGAEMRGSLRHSTRGNTNCVGFRRLLRNMWKFCVIGGSIPVFGAIWAVIEYKMNTDEFRSNLLKLADSTGSDAETLQALLPVVDLLNSMTTWTYVLALVGAIVSIQIGLYTLFQLSFHPQLSIFTRTMSSALRQFAAFFAVWIIAFLIFVCVGSILFGSDVEEFSTRLLTTQACINMLFGTFDYDSIKDLQFAYIFYWCFMIVVSLVLLNMMLAIVLDAYTVVREESYKGEASLMLNGRITDFCLDKLHGRNPARCALASSKPPDNDVEAQVIFDRIKADIRKLPTEYVILRKKVNPSLLLHVLQAKMELEYQSTRRRTRSPTKLTAQTLVETFPGAKLTAKQLDATFKYLHEGVVINKSAIKQAQKRGVNQANRDEDEHDSTLVSSVRSGGDSFSVAGNELVDDQDASRLASLERKLDRLLDEILATQAAIRDARFA
ncbi:Polycystic kidney disease 2 1 protein [Phytophthora cinnamomi]|uniref:Polycystic kidney disease 2 1 protein n=1 Tax=Phytophthora cinnamomi TaxID=4785 RepID=UPI0035593C6E|nr:Polycystic kidney disease 2 1 protein [Phytophthora cinnamomi]